MEVTRARADTAQKMGNGSATANQADPASETSSPGRKDGRPGKVIALLNQKGGAGKTTLATHLAGELALQGNRVTLLDADPQGSALDWAQRRLQSGQERLYGVFGLARDCLHQEAPQVALQADFVVIDGPPRVAALARSALLAADLVLIPVQPSAYDVWASHEMVQLVIEARVFRPALRAAFVINRRVVGTVIGREARTALADQPFAALNAEISQRIVFADSVAAGRLAGETAPKCVAAREIAALAQAVREMLR
ncbi:Sporulation initiation inhibitor protein soj [Variovorax sp. PBS-H4]|uniref:ParA family partition ATPase n=1 Tax=Variovorax sp. PBS-H4 TaxID=434008 RepID=UPI0013173BA6|nr:ParA family partition ATPase [Variovorax sp. PBS-H4]VTU37724.1 Sporulation initiation inhibitor protein soj [Variovorax sp. PBS-H4]